jgi:hypothetical protein
MDVVATDVATQAGIAEATITFRAAIGDINGDGAPDFLLGRHLRPARLYVNGGTGSFAETDVGNFVANDRHECAWFDANGDGQPDVFCAVGADRGKEVKKNELWLQQPDGSFVNQAAQFGVMDPLGRGRRPVALDVNGDGWTDLYVVNRHARADGFPSVDRLYLNQGGSYFVDAPSYGLDLEIGIEASCAVTTDLNGDGWSDLAVCGPSTIRLYRNVNGTSLQDVTSAMDARSHVRDAKFVDMNGDGTLVLVAAFKDRVEVRFQVGGVFQPPAYTFPANGTLAVAVGDVNDDGAPDMYVLRGTDGPITNASDVMLLNAGTGGDFSQFSIPTTSAGHADGVEALDYDGNGLTDFLVLNGAGLVHPGPIQLIAFFPA